MLNFFLFCLTGLLCCHNLWEHLKPILPQLQRLPVGLGRALLQALLFSRVTTERRRRETGNAADNDGDGDSDSAMVGRLYEGSDGARGE